MEELAKKKVELNNIREMEEEFHRTQEKFKEEKKKKESKMAGNKSYMNDLQKEKDEEENKLKDLQTLYDQIQQEEDQEIAELEENLARLQEE